MSLFVKFTEDVTGKTIFIKSSEVDVIKEIDTSSSQVYLNNGKVCSICSPAVDVVNALTNTTEF